MSSPAAADAALRPSLAELLAAHESVDNAYGTDKNTSHSYGELYEALFAPRRDSVRAVLELGVYSGASAVVWAEYFASAVVVGADITLARVRFGADHPRIRFVQTDATVAAAVAATRAAAAELGVAPSPGYDVILDDASHDPRHQVASAELFVPSLAPGGIYVIEDIAEDTAAFVRSNLARVAAEHGLAFAWHDLRDKKRRFDDIVAVLERPAEAASA
jgi:predicted O-methyltransferase YrrM